MNNTLLIKEMTDLFIVYDSIIRTGVEIEDSPLEPELSLHISKVLSHFGLNMTHCIGEILFEFLSQDDLTPKSLEETITTLSYISVEVLSEPVKTTIGRNWNPSKTNILFIKSINQVNGLAVLGYVRKYLSLPLSTDDYRQIEVGFSMVWCFASISQPLSLNDFIQSVDKYLNSVEYPMERKLMIKIVELMMEYLIENGHLIQEK